MARWNVLPVLALLVASWPLGCASPPRSAPAPTDGATLTADAEAEPVVETGATGPDARVERGPLRVEEQPWTFAAYPGVRILTDHYDIYTTIRSERIRARLPVFLEAAIDRYTHALTPLPPPARPLETYIFRDRRQWLAKTRQVLPKKSASFDNLGRGGFSTEGMAVLYYIDWGGRDGDTFAIAAHEGWHQYTQSTFKNALPVWLEEGIATWMEGYRYRHNAEAPTFTPSRNWERSRALGEALRADKLIPFRDLLEDAPQTFLSNGKSQLLTYYAQVWAMTRFLLEYDEGRYRDGTLRAITDAAEGRLYRTLLRNPMVLAHGGRTSVSLNARRGAWLLLAYLDQNLFDLEAEYLEFVERVAR